MSDLTSSHPPSTAGANTSLGAEGPSPVVIGTSLPLLVKLMKIGPGDDPQAFLVIFERVMAVVQWPPEYWGTLLAQTIY